jgi:uncharacterized membrane protein YbhN (UPF0104 family)
LVIGFAILLAGLFVSWLVYRLVDPTDYLPSGNYTAFAGLFVAALAIERLLEPFSGLVLPSTDEKKVQRDEHLALARVAQTPAAEQTAIAAQKNYARARASRAVILWAVASLVGMLMAAVFGLFLIRTTTTTAGTNAQPGFRSVGSDHKTAPNDPNRLLDLLVTGLVVGAGTKPLHDLVTRIQAKSDTAKDEAGAAK